MPRIRSSRAFASLSAPWIAPLIALFSACAILASGCGSGNSSGNGGDGTGGTPLVLAAGVTTLSASMTPIDLELDLARANINSVEDTYELTTPANKAFTFHAVSRARGNTGALSVSVTHVDAGGATPIGGAESLALAGITVSGTGIARDGNWLRANGDGFARLTIQGSITEPQVLALRAETAFGTRTALVRIGIGPESEINVAATNPTDYAGVIDERTLYSSDSWQFSLPTIAVSGDRVSMVAYEGDLADPWSSTRYELRLQYEPATDTVTAGGAAEASPDSGNWRDHEIAALYNVIALIHGGIDEVSVRLSFDRGATFAQTKVIANAQGPYSQRLAQVTMAADYTLAVAYWQTDLDLRSTLFLVEGQPSEFDANGSPLEYSFSDPVEIHRAARDVTPLAMGVQYSAGGDLVIGYGYSWMEPRPTGGWTATTRLRCAVRLYGEDFRDTLVDEEKITGLDPSVALLGSGDTLRIFYAYEMRDGVRLRVSEDAGQNFEPSVTVGGAGAYFPSVFARSYGSVTRVDLLFLTYATEGLELHLAHWDDYPGTVEIRKLTTARSIPANSAPPDDPVPGMGIMLPIAPYGLRITQLAWFGYDAVLDGDDLVVVLDEQTFDTYYCCGFSPLAIDDMLAQAGMPLAAEFIPAEPPPLAPGMTEPVPAPNPDAMHQLRLLRLD